MKKIVIVANFTRLPWENGNSRFPYIANLFNKNNFNVELITSSFSHDDKKKREDKSNEFKDYKITLLDEAGYSKNVSLKRFYSHYVLARNLKKYLNKIDKPDIIYCAVPSLSVGKVVAQYAQKNNVRFIVDVQDLWPEAFKMVLKIPVISDLIFFPMKKQADYIYSSANDIIAVSDTYVERACKTNKKYNNKLSVFLGTDLKDFDELRIKNKISYNDDIIRIAYIGTLGHSYDIKNVISAIKVLNEKNIKNVEFIVMGSGPLLYEFEKFAKEKNVKCEFTGRLEYPKMIGKLCACDIAVNPIIKGAAQSIINKVGDYAAAGLPVINTQECIEYRKLVEEYNIGINVENENVLEIAKAIEKLYLDKKLRKEMGENNRKLAEEKFDRKVTYLKIKELIENENI